MYQMSHYSAGARNLLAANSPRINYSPLERGLSQLTSHATAQTPSYISQGAEYLGRLTQRVFSYFTSSSSTSPSLFSARQDEPYSTQRFAGNNVISAYASSTQEQESYHFPSSNSPELHFQPDHFLKPGMHGAFIGKAEEIEEFVEQAFQEMFQTSFPEDIKVRVLDDKEFQKLTPNANTLGLSINRRKHGLLSEIFVRNGPLARVLLTFGHELGHVLTPTLSNQHDEEAKAFAFSFAWMDIIKQHNIANLKDAFIEERPALNGLHDLACHFVQKIMRTKKTAWQVYKEIVQGLLSIKSLKEENFIY